MIKVPLQQVPGHPTRDQPVYVEIHEANLPADTSKVCLLLEREQASIELWLEIAVSQNSPFHPLQLMYYRSGNTQSFQHILSEALKDRGLDQRYTNKHLFANENQRVRAMNALAGHQLNLAEAEQDPDRRRQHLLHGY